MHDKEFIIGLVLNSHHTHTNSNVFFVLKVADIQIQIVNLNPSLG